MVPNGTEQDSVLLPEMYENQALKEKVTQKYDL